MTVPIKLNARGQRGESAADIARRLQGLTNATDAEALSAQFEEDLSAAQAAAIAAAETAGPVAFFDTVADAEAAVGSLANGDVVAVLVDEDHDDKRSFYRKESGSLVFKRLAYDDPPSGTITAPMITADAEEQAEVLARIGGVGLRQTFAPDTADGIGVDLTAEASEQDFDMIRLNFTVHSGFTGTGVHIITQAESGVTYAQSVGGAMTGPGKGYGGVGNRRDDGEGSGLFGTRDGTGEGAGVEGAAYSEGVCYAGLFTKVDPVGGTAGEGPAVFAINNSANGQAFYARSSSGNTNAITSIVERLNALSGTGQLVRVVGGGARSGLLIGSSTYIVPGATSSGSAQVYGHDVQITAHISGSVSSRGLNVYNSATSGTEAIGALLVVDGVNTDNYGLFVNVANGTTNTGLYMASSSGLALGGVIRPLSDGSQNIGSGGARFGTIYAATGTINTSDAREKTWRGALTEAHLRAACRIGALMGLFQWNDQIAEKGEDGARIHFGAVAQDVVEIFYDEGLEVRPAAGADPSFRHAMLCYDRWDDVMGPVHEAREVEVEEPEVDFECDGFDAAGRPIIRRIERVVKVVRTRQVRTGEEVVLKAGERYGLRLDQLALFLAAAHAQRLAQLEARLAA